MPYIDPENRDAVNKDCFPEDAGELNYVITKLCHEYLEHHGVNYRNINTVVGVLECAKLELYRQVAAPYEDKKKSENGSVSELDK